MRMSRLFGRTLREAPADAETTSHQLLLRAGFIDQLMAGAYSYMPLGHRTKLKVEQIVREEMDAAGGQEVLLRIQHVEQGAGADLGFLLQAVQRNLRGPDLRCQRLQPRAGAAPGTMT